MKKALKYVGGLVLAAGAAVAQAAGSIDISASTTQATTDVQTAGGLIVGVVVAVAAIGWIRRVIR